MTKEQLKRKAQNKRYYERHKDRIKQQVKSTDEKTKAIYALNYWQRIAEKYGIKVVIEYDN